MVRRSVGADGGSDFSIKYGELLDKYGDSDEAEAIIAKEMGWDRQADPDAPMDEHFSVEEMNRICEQDGSIPRPELTDGGLDTTRPPQGCAMAWPCHRAATSSTLNVNCLHPTSRPADPAPSKLLRFWGIRAPA